VVWKVQAVANVVMLAETVPRSMRTLRRNAGLSEPEFGRELLQRDLTPAQKARLMSKAQVMLGMNAGQYAAGQLARC